MLLYFLKLQNFEKKYDLWAPVSEQPASYQCISGRWLTGARKLYFITKNSN